MGDPREKKKRKKRKRKKKIEVNETKINANGKNGEWGLNISISRMGGICFFYNRYIHHCQIKEQVITSRT
jgi:hypothetical protein